MSLTDSLEQFKGLPLKWPHSTLTSPGRVLCSLSTAVVQSTAWEKKKKAFFILAGYVTTEFLKPTKIGSIS